MAQPQSQQLLEKLLAGHQLSADELDGLISNPISEDLYLDYKHGNLLAGKNPNETIREYTSAFANSSGGILIIGVNESSGIPIEVTGCNNHSKGHLTEWASRCLTPIASHFAPPPRFHVINHLKGDVLVCVVQRSLNLVPIAESGGIVYYFRIGDQTLKAPDYFMADLLLGRRQQPIFEIEEFKALNFQRILDDKKLLMDLSFEIRCRTANASMVWADESKWGIIFWAHDVDNRFFSESGKPSAHLLTYLEVKEESFEHPRPKRLIHYHGPAQISKPFDVNTQPLHLTVPLRVHDKWFSYIWKAALYYISKNSQPTWYQIDFFVDINAVKLVDEPKQLVSPCDSFSVRKLTSERPIVAWEEYLPQ